MKHHRGHARPRRVTRLQTFPSPRAAFVPAASRQCPRFPLRCSMVKEGVDGSSPSEGPLGKKNCPPFITGSDFLDGRRSHRVLLLRRPRAGVTRPAA